MTHKRAKKLELAEVGSDTHCIADDRWLDLSYEPAPLDSPRISDLETVEYKPATFEDIQKLIDGKGDEIELVMN